ncbi:LysR family transcriptional regulator [Stenotrophomonas sp. 24(2023)]|uniref:LysR family transcriptional regulator n=1 Tax=Stenotrophomonas sp. 24(2023) TaxID=3068324 RepID=UPI0027E193DF|nr:LysR family transcriptional regulator [Stenotrophomonas sp. 24(2023)]WMJ70013.1 LysR family transcriptional regulator [Stenotrophomonas sp. 24(2023)]
MQHVDLNLLAALDVLLAECSVTRAAQRLGLSASAMSRTLARLRAATGDPLLVLAGRQLVPTPYALQLGERVHGLAQQARAVLQPAGHTVDLATVERTFTLRANEGFISLAAAPLLAALAATAPGVALHFVPKPDKDATPLRDGLIDLEIGVLGTEAPELRTRPLLQDRFVGICRTGHPLLSAVSPAGYAAARHVVVARRRTSRGPVDEALAAAGLQRRIALVVLTYANAIAVVRGSDLVGLVPALSLGVAASGGDALAAGIACFELPVPTPAVKIRAIWHPRHDADPVHRWLRDTLATTCQGIARTTAP